jgi:uncharacterized membrane protein YkvA (DUF1232 family)
MPPLTVLVTASPTWILLACSHQACSAFRNSPSGLLPDQLRLLPRLAADRSLPRRVRVGLAVLLAYLACPFGLVPDFILVLGYADDAIIVAVVLRWAVRRAGVEAIRRQWPGTDDGFAVLCRVTGLAPPSSAEQPAARED